MDKTTLVESDIGTGYTAVKALEVAGLPIAAAMWLKLRDAGTWNLYITSPDVEKFGPTTIYLFVTEILKGISSTIEQNLIIVTNTTNHFVNSFARDHIAHWPLHKSFNAGAVLKINNFTLEGADVESAIVYKIAPRVKPSKVRPQPNSEALKKARALAA